MLGRTVPGKVGLKRSDFRPHDKPRTIQDALNRRIYFRLNLTVLRLQIDQRDGLVYSCDHGFTLY